MGLCERFEGLATPLTTLHHSGDILPPRPITSTKLAPGPSKVHPKG